MSLEEELHVGKNMVVLRSGPIEECSIRTVPLTNVIHTGEGLDGLELVRIKDDVDQEGRDWFLPTPSSVELRARKSTLMGAYEKEGVKNE